MATRGFASLYTWLHLSDIHVGHGGAWRQADQVLVLDAVSRTICDRVGGAPPFDSVLITGDVAATGAVGSRDEYRRAADWLAGILRATGTPAAEVFVVPGNHDVQREPRNDADGRRLITGLRRGRKLDDALATAGDAQRVLRGRQARFMRWAKRYGTAGETVRNRFTWRHHRDLGRGLRLRLVGLNTALLCTGKTDRGKLELGRRQIVETLARPQVDDDEVVLVLGHHPLTWLRDEADAEGWLQQRAHVYLCGHEHRARSQQTFSGSGQDLITVSAGAAHEPAAVGATDPRHGYNVSSLGLREDGALVLRVWSQVWSASEKRFEASGSGDPVEHVLRQPARTQDGGRRSARTRSAVRATLTLDELFARAEREAGSRRTAYPSDLSFEELRSQNLYVSPEFDSASSITVMSELVAAVAEGKHTLLLGDPGAGKSFASYLTLTELGARGNTTLPVDIRDLRPNGWSGRVTRRLVLRTVTQRLVASNPDVTDDKRRLVLVIDGLDELLSTGFSPDEVARDLSQLARIGTVLVTCRIREYRDMLATRVPEMGVVAEVRPWDFEAQFVPFARRLAATGRLTSVKTVVELVRGSNDVRKLVRRPLYARMLTFVVESGGDAVTDRASLYRAYLEHLARTTEAALARAGYPVNDVYGHWRAAVWWAFQEGLVIDDGMPLTPLLEQLAERGVQLAYTPRVISTLTDTVQVVDDLRVRFLHFSFLEYLIAEEAARLLRTNAGSMEPMGPTDLTVEMRHFLTWITDRTATSSLPERMIESYRRSNKLPLPRRLTVNNLLAYVLARLRPVPVASLRGLLDGEDQPFLRTSLHWALSNAGDEGAFIEYLGVLRNEPSMADLNRGYLLYYYGDLDRTRPPPYIDDGPPYVPWTSTRQRTIEMIQEPGYRTNVMPSRRLLDVATFVDFLEVREEEPRHDEHRHLADAVSDAGSYLDSAAGKAVVADLMQRVGGRQLAWLFPA